jgi:6,7-dimethyl-8-ribityllumazine synthase
MAGAISGDPMVRGAAATLFYPLRVAIVESRYYVDLADELVKGALIALSEAKAEVTRIIVPGALEIPGAIGIAASSGQFDAFVALGTVIRGETSHYDTVSNESARGIMNLTTERGLAIGNGILTVENAAQAWARARVTEGAKGAGAADAALALALIKKRFGPRP